MTNKEKAEQRLIVQADGIIVKRPPTYNINDIKTLIKQHKSRKEKDNG